jgi:hypothetical protein
MLPGLVLEVVLNLLSSVYCRLLFFDCLISCYILRSDGIFLVPHQSSLWTENTPILLTSTVDTFPILETGPPHRKSRPFSLPRYFLLAERGEGRAQGEGDGDGEAALRPASAGSSSRPSTNAKATALARDEDASLPYFHAMLEAKVWRKGRARALRGVGA